MDTWLVIAMVVAIVAIALVALTRRAMSGTDPTRLTLDPAVVESARSLTILGRRMQAIRTLREGTPGLSVLHATAMVDKMAERPVGGRPATSAPIAAGATPPVGETFPADPPPGPIDLPADVELQVLELVSDGRRDKAVELVRAHTGWSLSDSETFVDLLN